MSLRVTGWNCRHFVAGVSHGPCGICPECLKQFSGRDVDSGTTSEHRLQSQATPESSSLGAEPARREAEAEPDRVPSAWSEYGDGHDYSRTGKHDPQNCRHCLRHIVAKVEASELAARTVAAEQRLGAVEAALRESTARIYPDANYETYLDDLFGAVVEALEDADGQAAAAMRQTLEAMSGLRRSRDELRADMVRLALAIKGHSDAK